MVNFEISKSIQYTTAPLEELLEQGQSLDFRLDENTWQDLKVGDVIEYWEDFTGWQTEPAANSRKVLAKIVKIYKAPTFPELFSVVEQDLSRLDDTEQLLQELRQWWDEERETKTDVLAFHVQLIKLM